MLELPDAECLLSEEQRMLLRDGLRSNRTRKSHRGSETVHIGHLFIPGRKQAVSLIIIQDPSASMLNFRL